MNRQLRRMRRRIIRVMTQKARSRRIHDDETRMIRSSDEDKPLSFWGSDCMQ
jgi:hypothetical protein